MASSKRWNSVRSGPAAPGPEGNPQFAAAAPGKSRAARLRPCPDNSGATDGSVVLKASSRKATQLAQRAGEELGIPLSAPCPVRIRSKFGDLSVAIDESLVAAPLGQPRRRPQKAAGQPDAESPLAADHEVHPWSPACQPVR